MDFKFYKGFNPVEKGAVKKPLPQKFGVRSTDDIIKDRYRRNSVSTDNPVVSSNRDVPTSDYQQRMQSQRRLSNLDK